MEDQEKRLTQPMVEAIERTINAGYRVEVIPVRNGVKLVRQRRDEVQVPDNPRKIGF